MLSSCAVGPVLALKRAMRALMPRLVFRPLVAANLVVTSLVVTSLVVISLAALQLGVVTGAAQILPQPRPQIPGEAARPDVSLDSLKQRDKELEGLRTKQRRILENEAKLKREIELMGDDRRKFNEQIIDTAARVSGVEERIAKTQERLAPLDFSEQALRLSLQQRRSFIAEVLAGLQRIGRQAPPALMIRAEDALQSVRSAMVLGAVLPELRQQAETLAGDLSELMRLRKEIADERDKLARDLLVLADERQRLSLMIEERQKRQAQAEQALSAERRRAGELARQAENLNQLITRLEGELDSTNRAARATARGSEDRKALDIRPDLAALRDPWPLEPGNFLCRGEGAAAFARKRGSNQGVWRAGRTRRH